MIAPVWPVGPDEAQPNRPARAEAIAEVGGGNR